MVGERTCGVKKKNSLSNVVYAKRKGRGIWVRGCGIGLRGRGECLWGGVD
jgi:hypothetical protein